MKRGLFCISIVLFVLGCATAPLYKIQDMPISANVSGSLKSMETVGQAIMDAAVNRGWTPVFKNPGLIEATFLKPNNQVTIEIVYSQTSYSINYKDSVNFNYDGVNIHRNYNNLVLKLSGEIQRELNKSPSQL